MENGNFENGILKKIKLKKIENLEGLFFENWNFGKLNFKNCKFGKLGLREWNFGKLN